MSAPLPESFWDLVRREVEALAPGPASRQQAALRRLVDGFSDARGAAPAYLGKPEALAAYTRAFLPQEMLKVPAVLARVAGAMESLCAATEGRALRAADCGSGPGAASLGLMAWCSARGAPPRLELSLCDHARPARDLAGRLAAGLASQLGLAVDVDAGPGLLPARGGYDLLLMQNALSEASADEAAAADVLATAMARLHESGLLIVIEPADRIRSRLLLGARDRLASAGAARIIAPCTRQGPCPALASPGWCAFEQPLSLPHAARLGLREEVFPRRELKWSYLVLSRAAAAREDPSLMRLVGPVRHVGGGHEGLVCGPAGRFRLRLLKRHTHEGNAPFRRLRWGDLLRLLPVPDDHALARARDEDFIDVGAASTVAGVPASADRPR